jgi:hypothetical protein
MKEYYLATAFTDILLQPQGDLNLFGLHATHTFWRDCLKKYGIQVDVWKHGVYKNFANQFTHSSFSKEHKENVANILQTINQHVCEGIYTARNSSLKQFEFSNFWKMVHRAGSFPADMAQRIGFIDHLFSKDPLESLLLTYNACSDKEKESHRKETRLDNFRAEAEISITDYAQQKKEEGEAQSRQWKRYQRLQEVAANSVVLQTLMGVVGYAAPYYNIPEVSLGSLEGSFLCFLVFSLVCASR